MNDISKRDKVSETISYMPEELNPYGILDLYKVSMPRQSHATTQGCVTVSDSMPWPMPTLITDANDSMLIYSIHKMLDNSLSTVFSFAFPSHRKRISIIFKTSMYGIFTNGIYICDMHREQHPTQVSPLLIHWRYCSLAINYRFDKLL